MKFLNRENEKRRLKKALESTNAKLIVLYGRRRCGKSTLIKQLLKPVDIYYMAQQGHNAAMEDLLKYGRRPDISDVAGRNAEPNALFYL